MSNCAAISWREKANFDGMMMMMMMMMMMVMSVLH
jgi:hypothetical protein